MGNNCTALRRRHHSNASELEVGQQPQEERPLTPEKSPGPGASVFTPPKARVNNCDSPGPGPDLVAVTMRCSCGIGCIKEEHLQTLLQKLFEGNRDFQWTLYAIYEDTAIATSSGDDPVPMRNKCFCSSYPIGGAVWPHGVTESTNTVMLDLWIQASSMTPRNDIKDYVTNTVGEWISSSLNNSDKVWIMSRYSYPTGGSGGAIEIVDGKGYQDGKSPM